ncbi:MAG: extracellular solute-binding protein, partial [Oscillospiraceae bacterium]
MKLRKILSAVLAGAMITASMAGCASSSSSSGSSTDSGSTPADGGASTPAANGSKTSITVWAPEEVYQLTQTKLDAWLAGQAEYADKYTITVSAMGEGEAATQLLTDVEAGADVYGFAQDQLARLVAAGALSAPGGVFLEGITANNDAGSVGAATLDGTVYAYPETSDNGYFLYYDKSVVSDPSTLQSVLDDCAAAGKYLYMDLQSGWYDTAFFFGTGAECYYEYDTDGNVTGAVCDYNSDAGLAAMKAQVTMASHPGFAQSTYADAALFDPNGGTAGAIVSGTWDSSTVKSLLGDNFGAAKLPTFNVDGTDYQMSGFGGFKLIGVKPQTDSDKLVFVHKVAEYLTGEEMQTARFEANGWGPSNKNVQASDAVQADEA